ncbi:hypothetical protein [Prosthecobacter sp.]|uniref:hypothetical protein n=1 Tax=Prosthecobacter sp. TaxID=1965333 RepID=UPI002487104E|nr:hypothetical protein [Prosthecobacter sp.]MDI1313279.1 hypothetical protein [Prosthecobacter sp.]
MTASVDGPDVPLLPPGSPPSGNGVPITPIAVEGRGPPSQPAQTSTQPQVPVNTTDTAASPPSAVPPSGPPSPTAPAATPTQPTAPESQPPQTSAASPSSPQHIPQNTTPGTADAPPGKAPSKEAAAAGPVMTLENPSQVLGDIERLKANAIHARHFVRHVLLVEGTTPPRAQ